MENIKAVALCGRGTAATWIVWRAPVMGVAIDAKLSYTRKCIDLEEATVPATTPESLQ